MKILYVYIIHKKIIQIPIKHINNNLELKCNIRTNKSKTALYLHDN